MAHENLSKGQQEVTEADTFFINSDATSNNEFSFHNEWLVRGVAVTSGGPEFLEKIKRPKRGDTLLLWVNKIGIVAAGTVLDDAPVIVYRGGGVVSPNEPEEYHRMVRWYADLRSTPVSAAEVVVFHGTNPRQAFGALNKGKEAILALIASRVEQNDIHDLLSRGKGRSTEIEILCQARPGSAKADIGTNCSHCGIGNVLSRVAILSRFCVHRMPCLGKGLLISRGLIPITACR